MKMPICWNYFHTSQNEFPQEPCLTLVWKITNSNVAFLRKLNIHSFLVSLVFLPIITFCFWITIPCVGKKKQEVISDAFCPRWWVGGGVMDRPKDDDDLSGFPVSSYSIPFRIVNRVQTYSNVSKMTHLHHNFWSEIKYLDNFVKFLHFSVAK